MSNPAIHKHRPVFSASKAVDAIAQALTEIKVQDGLTDADLGAVLGKSGDQAAKYRTGLAVMDAVTFGRAKREWNGRFTGYFDRLCVESRQNAICDRGTVTDLLTAVTALNAALEDDDKVDAAEVMRMRPELEAAFDSIGHHLSKLQVREAV